MLLVLCSRVLCCVGLSHLVYAIVTPNVGDTYRGPTPSVESASAGSKSWSPIVEAHVIDSLLSLCVVLSCVVLCCAVLSYLILCLSSFVLVFFCACLVLRLCCAVLSTLFCLEIVFCVVVMRCVVCI